MVILCPASLPNYFIVWFSFVLHSPWFILENESYHLQVEVVVLFSNSYDCRIFQTIRLTTPQIWGEVGVRLIV